MSDEAISNLQEYSVSELSQNLKRTVEDRFAHVRVRGELSGVKRAASGHVYLGLKDENAVMDGVCWRGVASKLSFRPEDGLEVICTGKLTTYPSRSKYQLVIERMEPAGAGALMALLEERKKKLAGEGLFAPERKKRLPYLPRTIGVVTSPTGSVIRDILHRLADRFPRHVLVWPVLVQGDGAAKQVANAIRGFNSFTPGGDMPRPDVLIVARGGGSIEDLWCFNEEEVVRAAAESDIPLISAVGHETDVTLIDYASDRRAPTPTGAAEMAVPVRAELAATVADLNRRLDGQRIRMIDDRQERVTALSRALPTPHDIMGMKAQKLDDLGDRLPRGLKSLVKDREAKLLRVGGGLRLSRLKDQVGMAAERLNARSERIKPAYERQLDRLNDRLSAAGRMLESLSYERVLDRGYALVSGADGAPISRAENLSAGDDVKLTFADGSRSAQVTDGEAVAPVVKAPKAVVAAPAVQPTVEDKPSPILKKTARRKKTKVEDDKQGQLF